MAWGQKHDGAPRALVFIYADNERIVIPISDPEPFSVGGQSYALQGLVDVKIETEAIARLEQDMLDSDLLEAVPDLGKPVAEWGKS